jgi:hypothetical protein
MNLYNTTNIKSLPQVEQVLPGNYLVVEDNFGTKKIDFDDFVIGPRNTSFYNSLDTKVKALSVSTVKLLSSNPVFYKQLLDGSIEDYRNYNLYELYTFTNTFYAPSGYYAYVNNFLFGVSSINAADLNVGSETYPWGCSVKVQYLSARNNTGFYDYKLTVNIPVSSSDNHYFFYKAIALNKFDNSVSSEDTTG